MKPRIVYDNGHSWVRKDKKAGAYVVFASGPTCSTSDSAYRLDDDGLSLAIYRADYLKKRAQALRAWLAEDGRVES